MLIKTIFREVEDLLEQASVPSPRRTAVWILCDIIGCSPTHLISREGDRLEHNQIIRIREAAQRCSAHEPVQYVLGYTDFCGLRLRISPAVLIPRPETEQLIEIALEAVEPGATLKVLDIGTGSGCIALSMKHALLAAQVTACDISAPALQIARENAKKNGLDIRFIIADLLSCDFEHTVGSGYDLVIANPPYIPDSERSQLPRMVRDYEPGIALFSGKDPLEFYRAIADKLGSGLLGHGGILVLETHVDYAAMVGTLLQQEKDVSQVQIKSDLAGLSRFVLAIYSEENHSVTGRTKTKAT
ncbi:MAG: peptide chain release factor N(5)-glutamine methyltransferase [Rhodothermaceae bacterium]|nr:peptide chain release factor N(5)-glutamine methyltransferase [Rhodothermaceae bacterium]MYF63024.1 peptide chain release factor N(5)-glutamine methyltransferase [Rhodothermaceae bacterium]MYI84898.1 peptide chain release factor N(5)-glutamine methyltransferase [Rhodothermaceae bacterium]